ncbi:MAG: hypothetical protein ACLGIW_07950, partial [Gammaproteobacteria bacterium]
AAARASAPAPLAAHCGAPPALGVASASPLPVPPQSHIYVGSKADWYEIRDGLPQHNGDSPR